MALAAQMVRIDPLWFYQHVGGFIAVFFLPVVYFLLYRRFRIPSTFAFWATVCSIAYLVFDGEPASAIGRCIFLGPWLGRSVLWILLIPLTLFLALRFLSRPTIGGFWLLGMAVICAVGLSNSGVYLIPLLLFGISLAYLMAYGFSFKRIKRAFFLNLTSFYCVGVGVMLVFGKIALPSDVLTWVVLWPKDWLTNLELAVGNQGQMPAVLGILVIFPLFFRKKPFSRFLLFLWFSFFILFATPLSASLWMKVVLPGSYWRFAYLIPVAWCFGLIVCLLRNGPNRKALMLRVVPLFILMMTIWFHRSPVMNRAEKLKPPWAYHIPPVYVSFVKEVRVMLRNRNLLAPQNLAVATGLLEPTVHLEAASRLLTAHLFNTAGKNSEGFQRNAEQACLERGNFMFLYDIFPQVFRRDVDAIAVQKRQQTDVSLEEILKTLDPRWHRAFEDNDFVLFLRRDELGR